MKIQVLKLVHWQSVAAVAAAEDMMKFFAAVAAAEDMMMPYTMVWMKKAVAAMTISCLPHNILSQTYDFPTIQDNLPPVPILQQMNLHKATSQSKSQLKRRYLL